MDAPELVIDDLKFPTGIASDEEENLFVADAANGSVQKLDRDGHRSTYIEACGKPSALAIDDSGDMFVADAGRKHILLFSPDEGTEVYANQCKGRRFAGPRCMYFSPTGELLFSDAGAGEVPGAIYSIDLNGETNLLIADLAGPAGLTIAEDAVGLYICESRSNSVVTYELDEEGGLVNREVFVEFDNGEGPQSLVFDAEGMLYVGRRGQGITTVDPDGKVVDEIALPGPNVTSLCFGGIDYDQLYAAEEETGAIYRFNLEHPGQRPFAGPRSV